MKKVLLVVVAFIFICVNVIESTPLKAASKTVFSVKVGKKISLKTDLKNAVWGSDNVSIATVSKKGVVKGISEGQCIVVATANGKSELFNITVKKKKVSGKIDVSYGEFSRVNSNIWLKEQPVAYINNNKVIYYETTYSEIVSFLQGSKYLISCDRELNDIVASGFSLTISLDKKVIATLEFDKSDSMIAKDAKVIDVRIAYDAPTNFFYFNKSFKPGNIPGFDEFKITDLFSEQIQFTYGDDIINKKNVIVANTDWMTYIGYNNEYYFKMTFCFESSSHKCISFELRQLIF